MSRKSLEKLKCSDWWGNLRRHMIFYSLEFFYFCLRCILKITRLYDKGYKNALNLNVCYREFIFPSLPSEFHGTRILFLSDLHLGMVKELPDLIQERIEGIEADVCLFGGDFRFSWTYPDIPYIDELRKIISSIKVPMGIYGVLGNHDDPKIVPELEELGIKMLVNSSLSLKKNGHSIFLAGIDQPFLDGQPDMLKTLSQVPQQAFKILLAHSPCFYKEAEERNVAIYLSGHTHNGQVRFPFIGPLITFTRAPRKFSGGMWRFKKMQGFTGSGVGTGVINVRFRCPPEITVLTLKSEPDGDHGKSSLKA